MTFNPDWDLPEATAESLREHMAIAKAAQESEKQFRATVAAALRELRAEMASMVANLPAGFWVNRLDAIISNLGLEER